MVSNETDNLLKHKIEQLKTELSNLKDTEQSLKKERDFNSEILYWIDSLVVVIDLNGYIVTFNRSSEELSGYRFEEVQNKPFWDILISTEEREGVRSAITDVVNKGLPDKFQNFWVTKDGSKRLISWVNSILKKPDGSIEYILCTGRDITEQKRVEDALKQSEEKYRELVQHANSIILRFDTLGRVTFFNEFAQSFFGFSEKEILDQNIFGTIIPLTESSGRDLKAMFEDIIRNPSQYLTNENENIKRDGERVWIAWTNKAIIDSDGNVSEILSIGMDITDRKKIEEQKTALEARLQQAQKMEAIGTLAGGIAHDFNNILSAVMGYTELALSDAEKESTIHQNLKEVFKASGRAKGLVQQILTFSRQTEQERKPIQVKLICKEAIKFLRASLPASIKIGQEINSESLVMADPTQIHQILLNLCTNAGYAMGDKGGVLEVKLKDVKLEADLTAKYPGLKPGPYLELTISDTGHGIPVPIIDRIFDPFFTTKGKGEGTGMGLSVVHGIVGSYEGTITVASEPGKGSIFKIYLPALERHKAPNSMAEDPVATGTERILLIDDETAIVNIGKQMLESLGYKITTRTSSIEALELFKAKADSFDLVITDLTMPNMTGDKLAGELIRIKPEIPVILCTGYSVQINRDQALAMGIRAFVSKPVLKREIAETIRKVFDQK